MKKYCYIVSKEKNEIFMPIIALGSIQDAISYIKTQTNNEFNFNKEWSLFGYDFDPSKSGEENLINYMNIDISLLDVTLEDGKYKFAIKKIVFYERWEK